jgi:putative transposase
MPRQPRYFIPGIPQHVITRGVDRQAVFFSPEDYSLYLDALLEASKTHLCSVHSYVLMTNHVHLLVTPQRERSLSLMMQAMGRLYVQRLNPRYQRTGTLWEGRYKASLVQSDRYFLECQRYIESNPVRAQMVSAPGKYQRSSYGHNALGIFDPLISEHDLYLSLHTDADSRRRAYRKLFGDVLSDEQLAQFRHATNACGVVGDDRFKNEISAMLGRAVTSGKRGRPKKRN